MHQPAEVLTHEAQAKAELYGDFIDKFTSNLTKSQIEEEKDFSLKERVTAYPKEMEKVVFLLFSCYLLISFSDRLVKLRATIPTRQ